MNPRRPSGRDLLSLLLELDLPPGSASHPRRRRRARLPMPGGRRYAPLAQVDDAAELESSLNEVATHLNEQLRTGAYTGVYSREAEVEQVLQTLASPLKGRVVLTGESRAGKTAVIHETVRRISRGDCPAELKGAQVWATSPAAFQSALSNDGWATTLDDLLTSWRSRPDIVLYFDDLPAAAASAPGDDDLSRPDLALTLLGHLRRGGGRMIAEAQIEPWRLFVDRYRDFEKLFLAVRLATPSAEAAHDIITRACEDLAILREIAISPEAIAQAYDLTERYFLHQALPGKVIDLVRDTLTVATPVAGATLTADDVTARFAEQTGLPRILLTDEEAFDDRAVREYFRSQVLAQEQAVEAIVQSLSLLRARVNNPLRPMGVFLFLGPTGVGKTELARSLSSYLYGTPERLIRFNMADYPYRGQQWELFGNPYSRDPATQRGQITTRLAGHAFSVLVLDEFEKADWGIFQRFLQLLDEGLLINGAGETLNLRNSIFILTSNVGARLIQTEKIGFSRGETLEEREARVLAETEQYFTPEFMNRIDAVCVFKPLSRAVMGEIARREVGNLLQREGLIRRQIEVEIDDEVIEHVVNTGYSQRFGARYLKRQIEKTIAYPLAAQINRRESSLRGGTIRLHVRDGRVVSSYLPEAEPDTAPAPQPAAGAGEARRVALAEIRAALPELEARVAALEQFHNVAAAREERDALMVAMSDAAFWNDQANSRRKLDAFQRASDQVDLVDGMGRALDELRRLCAASNPPLGEAARHYNFLLRELPRVELTMLFSGPHDALGAYLQVRARGRPEAARRWVRELAQMYLAWAGRRGFLASVVGEEWQASRNSLGADRPRRDTLRRSAPAATTAAVTLAISGYGVFGLLKGEAGLHRLVQSGAGGKDEPPQKINAQVRVLPDWPEGLLPHDGPARAEMQVDVSAPAADQGGVLIKRLATRVTAIHRPSGRSLSLAGELPPDDLAEETVKLLWTELTLAQANPAHGESDGKSGEEVGNGLVRTYLRHKQHEVRDHRTGLKLGNLKKVLEGGLDELLEARLKAA